MHELLLLPLVLLLVWLWQRGYEQRQRLEQLEASDQELRQAIAALKAQLAGPPQPAAAATPPDTGPAAAATIAELPAPSAPDPSGSAPPEPAPTPVLAAAPTLAPTPTEAMAAGSGEPAAPGQESQSPDPQKRDDQAQPVAGLPAISRQAAAFRGGAWPSNGLAEPPAPAQNLPPSLGPAEPPALAPARSATWQRLERLLIDHWTGIVGVMVVVAGITFLAINLALRLSAFERFLLLLAAAALLAAPSLLAARRPGWGPLAAWMRSGAAALVLFACAASGGLQWLQQPLPALALLSLGMGLNLGLAVTAASETLAALHVAVNLLPLAIVPASGSSLLLASGVALIGQLLPRRRPWQGERLVVGVSYDLFFCHWLGLFGAGAGAPSERGLALAAAVVVFGAGALLPQLQGLAGLAFTPLTLMVQLLNWGGLTLSLQQLPEQLAVRVLGLAAAALAGLLLGVRAHRLGWIGLGRSQLLIAQTLFLTCLQSLDPLLPDTLLLALAVLVESALFLRLAIRQADPVLRRVAWGLAAGSGGWLLLTGLDAGNSLQASSVMLIAGSVTTKLERDLGEAEVPQPLPGLFSWWAALQFLVGSVICGPVGIGNWLALATLGTLTSRSRGALQSALSPAIATAVLLTHLIGWGRLLTPLAQASPPLPAAAVMLELTPLLLLASTQVISGQGLPLGLQLGVHLIGGSLLLAAPLLLGPIASPLPGVAWLLLSLLALELARRLPRPFAVAVLQQGLLALAIGLIAAITLPLGLDRPTLLLIEVLAFGVLLRWWFVPMGDGPPGNGPQREGLGSLALWRQVHPYLLELNLLLLVVILSRNLPAAWQTPGWLLLALALLSPWARRWFEPRLQIWSVIAVWIGILLLILQPEAMPLVAIALVIAYVVLSHHWLQLQPQGLPPAPPGLGPLHQLGLLVGRATNPLLYYPLFLAVAVVLASHFDHSLLTLLWAGEAFVIYVLSAVLRDKQLRAVALIALGGCLWRLVVVDLAEADLTSRGLVFLGVGLLMLAMNAIASRFSSRFR
jgi:hypothetical protein